MLQSLANFIRWMGYPGLVILFDEAEMTHTTMRKSSLRQAHNNLLHLINEIHDSPGIILVYATVPSFFTDPTHGIQIYGALAQIDKESRAVVWTGKNTTAFMRFNQITGEARTLISNNDLQKNYDRTMLESAKKAALEL